MSAVEQSNYCHNGRYSQDLEEAVIVEFFKGEVSGRFLDIGAADGEVMSNTRRLAEAGWRGVCIEPSPSLFVKLMDRYKNVEGMALVHAAVTARAVAPLIKFYDSGAFLVSTTEEAHSVVWSASGEVKYQPIYIPSLTAKDLITTLPGPYDFVTIDVEGTNLELIQALPLVELGTRLVCVEIDSEQRAPALTDYLVGLGYRQVDRVGCNFIARR